MANTVVLLGFLLVVLGFMMVAARYKRWRIARTVSKTPLTSASAVGNGDVVGVRGEAVPVDGTTTAPISQTEETLVAGWEVKEFSNGSGKNWHSIGGGILAEPFYVEDETGRVRVEPGNHVMGSRSLVGDGLIEDSAKAGVEIRGVTGEFERFGTFQRIGAGEEPPEHIEAFVADTPGISSQRVGLTSAVSRSNDRRYYEGSVQAGESVFVLGRVATDEHGVSALRPDGGGPFLVSAVKPSYVVSRAGRSRQIVAAGAGLLLLGALLIGIDL